ncbi:MAG: response regulator [Verrucomicrobia bacterium]|jgi:CheY-like chemotaxis protein|nr:response regulator [Verrucomicrobiota bacterium]
MSKSRLQRLPVLIAEDNKVNQRLLQLMLKHLGYTTVAVENGLEACARLARTSFSLIFMDIQMPVMNGLDATREIRATIPESQQPFIIGVTGLQIKRAECLEAGMDEYIPKPIDLRRLHLLLRKLADRCQVA